MRGGNEARVSKGVGELGCGVDEDEEIDRAKCDAAFVCAQICTWVNTKTADSSTHINQPCIKFKHSRSP